MANVIKNKIPLKIKFSHQHFSVDVLSVFLFSLNLLQKLLVIFCDTLYCLALEITIAMGNLH